MRVFFFQIFVKKIALIDIVLQDVLNTIIRDHICYDCSMAGFVESFRAVSLMELQQTHHPLITDLGIIHLIQYLLHTFYNVFSMSGSFIFKVLRSEERSCRESM